MEPRQSQDVLQQVQLELDKLKKHIFCEEKKIYRNIEIVHQLAMDSINSLEIQLQQLLKKEKEKEEEEEEEEEECNHEWIDDLIDITPDTSKHICYCVKCERTKH